MDRSHALRNTRAAATLDVLRYNLIRGAHAHVGRSPLLRLLQPCDRWRNARAYHGSFLGNHP